MKTVRITHMIGGGEFGGAEMHLLKLFQHLSDVFDLHLITIYNGQLAQTMRDAGYPVHVLSQRGRFDLSLYRQLVHRFKTDRPHLVHTHGVRANFFGRLAAKRLGLPTVTTVHSFLKQDYPIKREYWMAYVMEHLTRPLVDHFITVSHALKDALQKERIPAKNITVIPNAIDTHRLIGGALRETVRHEGREKLGLTDERLIVSTSRLVPVKGIDVLIEAFYTLRQHRHDVKLVLIGDGTDKRRLMERVATLGLKEDVFFLGYRKDIPELLTMADVFVLPSRMEGGFPLSLMESLAAGIPAIATQLPAILEWTQVWEKHTAAPPIYLVPPDDPHELHHALHTLFTDHTLWTRLKEEGKKFIEATFSLERFARDTRAVYEALLSNKRHI